MAKICSSLRLVAVPVYNEETHIDGVIKAIRGNYSGDILLINDGSTDDSSKIIANQKGIESLTHEKNLGYGKSLVDAFEYAGEKGYHCLVTIDCDEQHEPSQIPVIFEKMGDYDIFSASRYLEDYKKNDAAPKDRYRINQIITHNINNITGYHLTDGFCGMKGYRVEALKKFDLKESGYAFPIEFWIQAYKLGLTVGEFPIQRIYKNLNRTFGGRLDNPDNRLDYYMEVLERELKRWQISSQSALTRTI